MFLEMFAKTDDLCGMDGTGKCNKGFDFEALVGSFGQNIVTSLLTIVGIASVIALIVAGIMMMTSAGDANKVAKSKKAMAAAIIGLIIAILGYAIAEFVVKVLVTK